MPIRWDKFTVKAQEAVQRANELASEHGNPELLPLHLLAALLEDKEGIVPPVLEKDRHWAAGRASAMFIAKWKSFPRSPEARRRLRFSNEV